MKKGIVVLGLMLMIGTGIYAQSVLDMFEANTSEGTYVVSIAYYGKNRGQQTADKIISENRAMLSSSGLGWVETDIKLSRVQLDLVRRTVNRYENSRGDTYLINFGQMSSSGGYTVIVEFTSATQYSYWPWSTHFFF